MAMRLRRLRQLIETARRTNTMDFEWTAEVCHWLLHNGGVDKGAREKVTKSWRRWWRSFRRRVEQWRAEGFDYLEDVWPLYERLLAAVELLAQRPDRKAVRILCETLRAIKVEEIAVKHLLG